MDVEHAVEQALEKARDIERVMSQYREGSTVSRINELAGDKYVKADEVTWHVIENFP
ncbi:MAG: FAD:protein FMN transferase [Pseudomonadota bacterium]